MITDSGTALVLATMIVLGVVVVAIARHQHDEETGCLGLGITVIAVFGMAAWLIWG